VSLEPFQGYSDEPQPLATYALLTGVFVGALGGLLGRAARTERLPERYSLGDVVLLGVAVHKVSRVVSRNRVTSFIRAPFTRYEEPANVNEVNESPRGEGLQRSIGELFACPLCIGAWVAGGFVSGLVFAPRVTRALAAMFSALTIADFLHLVYATGAEKAE
jgi:hypothetical protein